MGLTGLLVEMKVRGLCGDTLFPQSLIFLHWMSADIEPQHLLLKAEQKLLLVLPDIGQRNLKLLFVLL